LRACKSLERALGREPGGPPSGPRTIDIDLLLLGDLAGRFGRLELPHPDLSERRFVLEPLVELDPQVTLPDGTQLAGALARVGDQRVEPLGPL